MGFGLRSLLSGVALLALAGGAAAGGSSPWGENYFPNLPVVTQDGKTLRFYEDVIKDRQVVVSFIYTSCPDICPLTTARLALVKDALGSAMGRDVTFVSMTVDPETDTPARLKDYAEAFGAGPGWLFLTGKPDDIRTINAKLGNKSAVLNKHRYEIVLGNDRTGDWQRDSPFGEIDTIVYNIRGMSAEAWEFEPALDSSMESSMIALPMVPGETLFRKLCTPCHTIGVGDRTGPDLRAVTARRSASWLSAFIASPGRMRNIGNPVALDLHRRYPGVKMPELGLTPSDVADLISYLEIATARLAAPEGIGQPAAAHDHSAHQHSPEPQ